MQRGRRGETGGEVASGGIDCSAFFVDAILVLQVILVVHHFGGANERNPSLVAVAEKPPGSASDSLFLFSAAAPTSRSLG